MRILRMQRRPKSACGKRQVSSGSESKSRTLDHRQWTMDKSKAVIGESSKVSAFLGKQGKHFVHVVGNRGFTSPLSTRAAMSTKHCS